MKARKLSRFAVLGVVGVALLFGIATLIDSSVALAGKPGGGGGTKCLRTGISCPDVYMPAICSNGVMYSNSCYAYVACATGCQSYGDPSIAQ